MHAVEVQVAWQHTCPQVRPSTINNGPLSCFSASAMHAEGCEQALRSVHGSTQLGADCAGASKVGGGEWGPKPAGPGPVSGGPAAADARGQLCGAFGRVHILCGACAYPAGAELPGARTVSVNSMNEGRAAAD